MDVWNIQLVDSKYNFWSTLDTHLGFVTSQIAQLEILKVVE